MGPRAARRTSPTQSSQSATRPPGPARGPGTVTAPRADTRPRSTGRPRSGTGNREIRRHDPLCSRSQRASPGACWTVMYSTYPSSTMIGAPSRSARRSIGRRRMQPRSKAATSNARKPGAGTIGGGLSGAMNANVASPTFGHRTAVSDDGGGGKGHHRHGFQGHAAHDRHAQETRRNDFPVGRAEPSSSGARTRRPMTALRPASRSPPSLLNALSTWKTRGPGRSPPAEHTGAAETSRAS